MELKLVELTDKNDVCEIYDIYKHCMFMPTEEKFNKKVDQFLNDNSVKIFACFSKDTIQGVIVISFVEQYEIEIIGIATSLSARGKGVGSFMIHRVVTNFSLLSVYVETDNDAVGFYRKNGFTINEFSAVYNGETVIRYKCKLNK
ncbi:MAG: GNAT family N-acetyltransferase [Clostridia bacterium]|nr:GNAT family N-acetyltransferase [Clostridia bacterium]